MKVVWAIALLCMTAACQKSPEGSQTRITPIDPAPEKTLEGLLAEMDALSADLACEHTDDCKLLPIGSDRCTSRPGPSDYLIYSALTTHVSRLLELGVEYNTLFLTLFPDPQEPCVRTSLAKVVCDPAARQCIEDSSASGPAQPEPIFVKPGT